MWFLHCTSLIRILFGRDNPQLWLFSYDFYRLLRRSIFLYHRCCGAHTHGMLAHSNFELGEFCFIWSFSIDSFFFCFLTQFAWLESVSKMAHLSDRKLLTQRHNLCLRSAFLLPSSLTDGCGKGSNNGWSCWGKVGKTNTLFSFPGRRPPHRLLHYPSYWFLAQFASNMKRNRQPQTTPIIVAHPLYGARVVVTKNQSGLLISDNNWRNYTIQAA